MEDVMQKLEEIRRYVAELVERVQPSLPLTLKRVEAAKLLSVSPSTIKSMLRTGEIIPTRVHGRLMIPSSEVVRIAGVKFSPVRAEPKAKASRKRTPGTLAKSEAEKMRSALKAARAAAKKRS